MKRATTIALVLFACRTSPSATTPPAPMNVAHVDGGAPLLASPPPTVPPERSMDLAQVLDSPDLYAATPAKLIVVLNVAALRETPVAARVRDALYAQGPGWELLVDKIDWVAWIGPSPVEHEELAVMVVRVHDGVALDWNIERMLRPLSANLEFDVGLSGVRAWRLAGNRHHRVIMRVRDDLAVITREPQALAAAKALRTLAPSAFSRKDLVLAYATPATLEGVFFEDMRLTIEARPQGEALARVTATCRDEATAPTAAETFRSYIERAFPLSVTATMKTTEYHRVVGLDLEVQNADLTALFEGAVREAWRLW